MSKSVIQHFKRASTSSTEKSLVSEEITDGSATSRFLQRMEYVRKSKVCNYLVNMSGKAPGTISEYKHQGRAFYLDPQSLSIFKQGLSDNNNVFTLGTYEAITEGKHTYNAQRKQAQAGQTNSTPNSVAGKNGSQAQETKELKKRNILEIKGNYIPDILPLGYYLRRREPRMLHIMPITMIYDGISYELKTKDFSLNGLQATIPTHFFEAQKKVLLSFSKFIDETRSIVGGTRPTVFKNVEFIIKNVQDSGEKTYLSMVQQNLSCEAKAYIQKFMDNNRSRYKFDASDVLQASKAKLCEHFYTHNSMHLPVFITWNKQQGFKVDAIISSEKNHMFFEFVSKNQSKPDLLPLLLPQRVRKLANLARNGEAALLFLYWQNNQLHSAFDFEYTRPEELAEIAIRTQAQSGMVFKITDNLNKKPHHEKMAAMLDSINKLDPTVSEMIERRIKETIAQFILTDISKIFFQDNFIAEVLQFEVGKSSKVVVWAGKKQVRLADGGVIQELDSSDIQLPQIVDLELVPPRNHERYQYKMDIDIYINEQGFSGQSIDFSGSGLGAMLNEKVRLDKNDLIEITFSTLMARNVSVDLKRVPFQVMIAKASPEGVFLGLERCSEKCTKEVNNFFLDLIQRNKEKLNICIKDKIDRVNMTFYEAYVTENIQTIPIVIHNDKIDEQHVREIGLTEVSCELAEVFYRRDYGYDLSLLTSERRLKEFHTRAMQASEKNSQDFMLYLYKETDRSTGEQYIVSVAEFEVKDKNKLQLLIDKTLSEGGSCIKVQIVNNLVIDDVLANSLADDVIQLNKAVGLQFSDEINEIIGFADLVDLTDEYHFRARLHEQLHWVQA